MTTTRELLQSSLRLINVVSTNEEPSAADMDVAREALNALLSSKSADLLNIHTLRSQRFVLTPGKATYTVGPSVDEGGNATNADWVTERPMRIEKAVLVLYAGIAAIEASTTTGNAPLTVDFSVTTTT